MFIQTSVSECSGIPSRSRLGLLARRRLREQGGGDGIEVDKYSLLSDGLPPFSVTSGDISPWRYPAESSSVPPIDSIPSCNEKIVVSKMLGKFEEIHKSRGWKKTIIM